MRKGYKTHVSGEKEAAVKAFAKMLKEYPIIGVVNIENLPSQQLNNMRKQLRKSHVVLKMNKRRLFKIAIEKVKTDKPGIEKIEEYLGGMPALMFAKDNPFALFKLLKKSKSKAPAKAGQKAPRDLLVNAGPTQFLPGPIISELAAVKIKTKVENGKLSIMQDTVVAKEGDVISDKLASILLRLGIEPMEIGLDLVAVFENGTVFTSKVLDIDEDKFMADLIAAARGAFNVSVEAAFPTKENIDTLVGNAFKDAKAVSLEANILNSVTVDSILAKANRQMLAVKSAANL
jgi:large subunit ribosomal protein L10